MKLIKIFRAIEAINESAATKIVHTVGTKNIDNEAIQDDIEDKLDRFEFTGAGATKMGAEAVVKHDNKDPHAVNKANHYAADDIEDDAFYRYAVLCTKFAASNPYFERISKIKLKRLPNGDIHPSYSIEKLFHATEVSEEMLDAMCNKMFSNYDEYIETPAFKSDFEKFLKYSPAALPWFVATSKFRHEVGDTKYSSLNSLHVADEAFTQCASVLKQTLHNFPGLENDLHGNNFMVRMGAGGLQMVVTDPFTSRSDL